MTASSLLDKIAAFEPRATTLEGGHEQLSCGAYAFEMRVDLLKLALG